MRCEPIALLSRARVLDKRFHEEPVELEIADPTAEVPFKGICGNESFRPSLITVCHSPLPIVKGSFSPASEIKCVTVSEPEVFD